MSSSNFKIDYVDILFRHGVNSIPELELMVNSGIGIDYLKKNELELRNLELKFPTKIFYPEINLPFLQC